MNIPVGEKYKLTSDKYNVVVNEKYEKQVEGQPSGEFDFKLSAAPFHPDLERACLAILNMDVLDSDAENLGELVQVIHKAKNDIREAVNIMINDKIQEQQVEIRSINAKLNKVKAVAKKADRDDVEVNPDELLQILNPKTDEEGAF